MDNDRKSSVKATHLSRKAVVYARQSTEEQVMVNVGSTGYQRNQVQHARDLGWPEHLIEVFDQDLGLSGLTAEHRPAYQRLLKEIAEDRIGAIFISDMTRIGREAFELFRLLDLCRRYDVLFVIDGKVCDPNDNAELLVVRFSATLAEHENTMRRENMNRGRTAKAKSGHAVSPPPAGYVRAADGSWTKDPDQLVRESVGAVFREFLKHRSCKKTVMALIALCIKLPRRRKGWDLRWTRPNVGLIYPMLRSPIYKGEYHYRRRTGDPRAGRDRRGRMRLRWASPEKVIVVPDHHEPYVGAEQWGQIQTLLKLNGPSKDRRNAGPGTALLQGIIRCGIHRNRLMTAHYKKPRSDGGRFHTYHCMGDYLVSDADQCGLISGDPIDAAVVDALMARLAPPSLEAIRDGFDAARANLKSDEHRRKIQLHRAREQADELERRYLAVDSSNRLVAKALETKLEEAKRSIERFERDLGREVSPLALLDDRAFTELVDLCGQLRALFDAPTTTVLDRKQILRLMIDRVVLIHRDAHMFQAKIMWADGTPHIMVQGARTLSGRAQMLIRTQSDAGVDPETIAEALNKLGWRTRFGTPWCAATVARCINRMRNAGGEDNEAA